MSLSGLSRQKYSGRVSADEAFILLKTPLDKSEFIFIICGCIKTLVDNKTIKEPDDLKKIHQAYFETQYERCIALIIHLISQNKEIAKYLNAKIEVKHNQFMLNINGLEITSLSFAEVNIYKNYSRRFFENRVSQFYTNALFEIEENLKAVDAIISPCSGIPISSIETLHKSITALHTELPDALDDRGAELIKLTKLYGTKDRGFLSRAGMSSNLGVLNANAPTPLDERSEVVLHNRVPDRGKLISKGYSSQNPREAFAGSVSGHVYGMIAILEDYMKSTVMHALLNHHINLALRAFMLTFVNSGFHSFGEMIVVIKQIEIAKLFEEKNVQLSCEIPEEILALAFIDAQSYNKTLCLNKATQWQMIRNKCDKLFQKKNWPLAFAMLQTLKFDDVYSYLLNAKLALREYEELMTLAIAAEEFDIYYTLIEVSESPLFYDVVKVLKALRAQDLNSVTELRTWMIQHPKDEDVMSVASELKQIHLTGAQDILKQIIHAEHAHQKKNAAIVIAALIMKRAIDKDLMLVILELAFADKTNELRKIKEATKLINTTIRLDCYVKICKSSNPIVLVKTITELEKKDKKIIQNQKALDVLIKHPTLALPMSESFIQIQKKNYLNDDYLSLIDSYPAQCTVISNYYIQLKFLNIHNASKRIANYIDLVHRKNESYYILNDDDMPIAQSLLKTPFILDVLEKHSDNLLAILFSFISLKIQSEARLSAGLSSVFREPYLAWLVQFPLYYSIILAGLDTLTDAKLEKFETLLHHHPNKSLEIAYLADVLLFEDNSAVPDFFVSKTADLDLIPEVMKEECALSALILGNDDLFEYFIHPADPSRQILLDVKRYSILQGFFDDKITLKFLKTCLYQAIENPTMDVKNLLEIFFNIVMGNLKVTLEFQIETSKILLYAFHDYYLARSRVIVWDVLDAIKPHRLAYYFRGIHLGIANQKIDLILSHIPPFEEDKKLFEKRISRRVLSKYFYEEQEGEPIEHIARKLTDIEKCFAHGMKSLLTGGFAELTNRIVSVLPDNRLTFDLFEGNVIVDYSPNHKLDLCLLEFNVLLNNVGATEIYLDRFITNVFQNDKRHDFFTPANSIQIVLSQLMSLLNQAAYLGNTEIIELLLKNTARIAQRQIVDDYFVFMLMEEACKQLVLCAACTPLQDSDSVKKVFDSHLNEICRFSSAGNLLDDLIKTIKDYIKSKDPRGPFALDNLEVLIARREVLAVSIKSPRKPLP